MDRPRPLYACPTPPESLTFPTYWYRLPNDDNFLICTKCYEEKLHSTPFANLLRCDFLDFGPRSTATCDFNTPSIDSLLRHGMSRNDFQPLLSFAERRLSIKSCSGTEGVKGGNGMKWFRPINDDIPGFLCCEACYEDVVLGTSFGPKFAPDQSQQPTDQTWSCDVAVPYLKRILPSYGYRGDWQGFVQASRHRISLPTCESDKSEVASTKRWYNTSWPSPIHDMTLCEACYLDRVGWQGGIAQHFAQIPYDPLDLRRLICDFRLTPVAACSDILLAYGMYEKWHYYRGVIMSKPDCNKEGIVNGEWYGLPDPTDPTRTVENFDICAACHVGWNESAGYGHLFRRLNYPHNVTRLCDFNHSAPRYLDWVNTWNQMFFTRNVAPFLDYVSRMAPLPQCPGARRIENARWYGDEGASLLICSTCFHEAVHGTHFASAFPLQDTQLVAEHHCSLYSTRMRERYAEACKQQSLAPFFDFATHREQIYQQTVPHLETFKAKQQKKIEMLNAIRQQRANATAMTAVGRGFMGGNPIVHGFDPSVQLLTINYRHQLNSIENNPERPRMVQLEAMWKEVE